MLSIINRLLIWLRGEHSTPIYLSKKGVTAYNVISDVVWIIAILAIIGVLMYYIIQQY